LLEKLAPHYCSSRVLSSWRVPRRRSLSKPPPRKASAGVALGQRLAIFAAIAASTWATGATAQPNTRQTAAIPSLVAYPGFYHGQPIVLHADLIETGTTLVLVQPEEARALRITSSGAITSRGHVEARGVFWDVGRLRPDDARVLANNIQTIADPTAESEWPKPGEVFVLHVTDAFPVTPATTPSLRDIALDAAAYVEKEVTVTGQFRGRNLYGDLAQAPGLSRWDFVLKSADAALWVTGTQPKGKGFDLNVGARIDTGRWLQVSGIVRQGRGLVWLTSVKIAAAEAPAAVPELETVQQTGPAPVVVFSTPMQGESDVPLETLVRIQFSRDMGPQSFKDQVRTSYVAAQTPRQAEPPSATPMFSTSYDAATRGLTIRFSEPLTRVLAVNVELHGGIKAFDGAALAPWTLSFMLGG